MTLILGLDIGTTSLKAILLDTEQGRIIHSASRPTPTSHPTPDQSEHDPEDLWQAVIACTREVIASPAANGQKVTALAIASMAEPGVLLDARGQPVSPIIAWYDRRSEPQANWIEQQIRLEDLYQITGQRVSPSFGVTKLLWLKENRPEDFARGKHWLPISTYLLWRCCGKMVIDYTIAARTLLFDQRSLGWSEPLCETFGLSTSLFPVTQPGGSVVGTLSNQAAAELGLPASTLCVLGGHDHLCAALATGAHSPGAVTDSTGSANALLLLLPNFQPDPLQGKRGFALYAYVIKDRFVIKGGLKSAGSAIAWLAKQFSPHHPAYAELEAEAARNVGQRAGPLWLPHLIGSGTPEGNRFSRAALVGSRIEDERGDLFRGMLESQAFWLRHNLEEMHQFSGLDFESLTLTGGATRLALLSQIKADVLGQAVRVPALPEAAGTGAALLAGLGSGHFQNPGEASGSLRYDCPIIEPDPQRIAWYDELYHNVYRKLYEALKPVNEALEVQEKSSLRYNRTHSNGLPVNE